MKIIKTIIFTLLLILVMGLSAFAEIVTTSQAWSFTNNTTPSAPDSGYSNIYGIANAEVNVGSYGSGWYNILPGLGLTNGYWDIGGTDGSIVITIPFTTNVVSGTGIVNLDYIYFKDISGTPSASVQNAVFQGSSETVVENVSTGGKWYKNSSTWQLNSNLSSPELITTLTGYTWGSVIDKVSVNTSCDIIPSGQLSGIVILNDWIGSVAGQIVNLVISDGTNVENKSTALDESGAYFVTTALRGNCTVNAKVTHWLSHTMPAFIDSIGAGTADFSLTNGDCSLDNAVDESDFGMISYAWYTSLGDLAYDPAADLNGDDSVDESDFGIISYAWYQTGD